MVESRSDKGTADLVIENQGHMPGREEDGGIKDGVISYSAIRSPRRTNNHATVIVEGSEETFWELVHILRDFKQKMDSQQKGFSYAVTGEKPYPRLG